MNLDKSTKEDIIQQLTCLSKQYEELLKLFGEIENLTLQKKKGKSSWTAYFKKRSKNRSSNTFKQ